MLWSLLTGERLMQVKINAENSCRIFFCIAFNLHLAATCLTEKQPVRLVHSVIGFALCVHLK